MQPLPPPRERWLRKGEKKRSVDSERDEGSLHRSVTAGAVVHSGSGASRQASPVGYGVEGIVEEARRNTAPEVSTKLNYSADGR